MKKTPTKSGARKRKKTPTKSGARKRKKTPTKSGARKRRSSRYAGSLSSWRKATPAERKANIAALNELATLFPTMPKDEVGSFLVEATAYPCASLPDCMPYVRDLATRSGGDWCKAIGISNEDMDAAMREANGPCETRRKQGDESDGD